MHWCVLDDWIEVKTMNRTTKSFIALACIAVLCAIAIPATFAGADSFLTANTTSQITVLGCNATYLITINNTGDETDTYNLTASNIDSAGVAVLNQSVITLDAGCSGNVILNVTDDDIIGPYGVIVHAASQTNADVTDEIDIITAVIEE
jgi:uncharacterized membrane protein